MAGRVDIVLDTNILLRMPFDTPAELTSATRAVYHLARRGFALGTTVANIAEFANTASRPTEYDGLGLTTEEIARRIRMIENRFPIFVESLHSYEIWKRLVSKYEVRGTKVHDARIASVMIESRIRAILTLNVRDFKRFQEVTAIHPDKASDFAEWKA